MKIMEIIGTLDNSVRVNEDPSLAERGHERDPVIVELPEGADTLEEFRMRRISCAPSHPKIVIGC